MKHKILVGGQAVIEGVMMRVPGAYATAVRKPDGNIEIARSEFKSLTERIPFLKKRVFRGIIALFEALKIGLNTLQLSADIAIKAEEEAKGKKQKSQGNFSKIITVLVAFILGFGIFAVLPLYLTTELLDIERKAITFNIIVGLWRIVFFLIYLWAISLMKDIQTLFQYHGAEHKVVFTFEAGKNLTIENTREFKTFHPRCGTSFIFIVLLVSILMFALIDSFIILGFGSITLQLRILFHLALLPLVAGVGYEFLKLTAKYQNKSIGKWLTMPGLWLQHITTKPPSDDQVEIAIIALKAAFGDKFSDYEGKKYIAKAVD
ncbi:MAG: DUF1385 domain-containing protein [Candidatus Marinimicrobia bacterium]|nr:DUF1385 domain-containing protein [Candidatus Neomarinimicrobiota bacterium]